MMETEEFHQKYLAELQKRDEWIRSQKCVKCKEVQATCEYHSMVFIVEDQLKFAEQVVINLENLRLKFNQLKMQCEEMKKNA